MSNKNDHAARCLVKKLLQNSGLTLSEIALQHGLTRQALSNAFLRPYPNAEKIIADALNVSPSILWPHRYDSKGRPNREIGRPRYKHTNTASGRNGKFTGVDCHESTAT